MSLPPLPSPTPTGSVPSRRPDADDPALLQLVLQLTEARQRAASARILAQVAVICAAFAGGLAIWVGAQASATGARAERLTKELIDSRMAVADAAEAAVTAELSRGTWLRGRASAPASTDQANPESAPKREEPWVAQLLMIEIEELGEQLDATRSQVASLQRDLASASEESRRYVDRRVQEQTPAQPLGELQTELGNLWVRVQMLEQRAGVR